MPLVDTSSVIKHTQIDDPDLAMQVVNHGTQAEQRMRKKLTYEHSDPTPMVVPLDEGRAYGSLYDDIVDKKDRFTQSDKDRLKKAETLYCYGEAIPLMNLQQATDGSFVKSTGFEQSRTNYKSQDEMQQAATEAKSQALRIAESLKPVDDRGPTWVL